ncbi:beta-lactamase family protein [Roseibacterium beibuensis]|uniref:serine hydrolase domain-containing protein n=1 Tax=[Roseibacterium] beibuensis TaxID=1193142 RepID=UPI00217DF5D4|nr:serine hydrolase domain-containing protein [Roseibacterium beibuensis]MCS6622549.1 beta-lactamase family protein [Roseibacterium beibuensis]
MAGPVSAPSRRAVLGGGAVVVTGFASLPAPARSETGLDAVLDLAMSQSSTGALVSRNGEILSERYATGWGPDRAREVASVAKSIVAVLIGMAVEDGAISSLDQPAAEFVPPWKDDARAAITLRHLMSMTSGLEDAGLALRGVAGDQFTINAAMPLREPPGTRWAYNTAAYHLLFHILARATGETVEAFAERRLLGPLGMGNTRWITSRGEGAWGPVSNYYSASCSARDLSRFGALILGGGAWNGRRLIGAERLHSLVIPSQDLNPSYGLLWWLNALPGKDAFGRGDNLRFPSAPRDTVAALGAGGQMVLVVPSRGMVVVRQGDVPTSATLGDDMLAAALSALPA